METLARALKGEGSTWFGLDNPALRGPRVFAVAIVAIEGSPDNRPIETFMPLTGMALLGPFTHACHVRDRRIDLFG